MMIAVDAFTLSDIRCRNWFVSTHLTLKMVVARPTDLHRVFIQTMLSRRVVRDEVGMELYQRAANAVKCKSFLVHLHLPAYAASAFVRQVMRTEGQPLTSQYRMKTSDLPIRKTLPVSQRS